MGNACVYCAVAIREASLRLVGSCSEAVDGSKKVLGSWRSSGALKDPGREPVVRLALAHCREPIGRRAATRRFAPEVLSSNAT
jgi:hypothetical protein